MEQLRKSVITFEADLDITFAVHVANRLRYFMGVFLDFRSLSLQKLQVCQRQLQKIPMFNTNEISKIVFQVYPHASTVI